MAKMREVNKKANAAKTKAADYTMVPIEMNGQTVMMKVCKTIAAPRGLTARCQG